MTPSTLGGIMPAIVTTLDNDERFYSKSFELLVETLYRAGCDGLYVCGQTGEGPVLPIEQRKLVAEAAIRNTPRGKAVIVHVGASNTRDTLGLARHAAAQGAAAVASLPPSGSYSFEEIRGYYQALAASVDIPVFVYYFPELYSSVSKIDQVLELTEISNIVGLKFTDYNLHELAVCRARGKVVFNGRDEVLSSGLFMGASGGIGTFYNLIPQDFVALNQLAQASRWDEAGVVQQRINVLIELTLQFPMLAAVKQMLQWQGIEAGPCVAPRAGLTDEQSKRLAQGLSALGYNDWAGVAARL